MATRVVRLAEESHEVLRELSEAAGKPASAILARAIEDYRRARFLEGLNEDFARLRADPEAWREELDERAAWDETIADGLEPE